VTITTPRRFRQLATAPTRRGDPVAEIEQIQDQMDQFVRSFFRGSSSPTGDQPPVWIPSADIEETDDSYIVELDLPSVKRDDVNIELRDREVRISGEIKQKERTGVLRRQTRRVGEFEFLLTLPGDIDPDNVEATLQDGVLTVRLGKATASQPRRVEVKG
jgi:HSP20 family protein